MLENIFLSNNIHHLFQVAMNPVNTVFDAKRLIGRRFDDAAVQSDMKHWPFNVVNDSGKPKIQVSFGSVIEHDLYLDRFQSDALGQISIFYELANCISKMFLKLSEVTRKFTR